MADFHFSSPEILDFPLEPEVFLGGGVQHPDENRRASVGRPQVRRIDVDQVSDDPQLVAFVEDSPATFYLVSIVCGLAVGENDILDSAKVSVDLQSHRDEAIAWSLSPLRLIRRVPAPKLEAGIDISLGPMLSIKGSWAAEEERDRCFVYAVGEREPDPEWNYRRTTDESLQGTHVMSIVAEVPPESTVMGTVQVEARLTHRNIIIRSKVTMPQAYGTFRLTAR